MSARPSMWATLDGEWHYLGRPLEGVLDIALLPREDGLMAPLFTDGEAAAPFRASAAPDLELLDIGSDDLRAKEEWLRAVLARGAGTVALDPDPDSLLPRSSFRTNSALWYILSHRRETACI